MKQPAIYILTNIMRNVFYTGVTSNLARRLYEHQNETNNSFTSMYNCKTLVYYESHHSMESAILREKQIKNMSRSKKILLIKKLNPTLQDISSHLI
jgi:putative endonuclease